LSETKWLKFGLINLSGNYSNNMTDESGNFSTEDIQYTIGVSIGLDYNKTLTDKFILIYGFDVQMTYEYLNLNIHNPALPKNLQDNIVQKYKPGIGFTFGTYYKLNQHFLVGVELNPSIVFYYNKNKSILSYYPYNYDTYGIDYSLSSSNAILCIKYLF
jgi:hypothetical protein